MAFIFFTIPDLYKAEDTPVQALTNTLYVLESHGLGDADYYRRVLIPAIKSKLEFVSLQGIIDTVWALNNAKLCDDKELWKGLLARLAQKEFGQQVETVYYKGFNLDSYERCNWSGAKTYKSQTERYVEDLIKGGGLVAKLKASARSYSALFWNRIGSLVLFNAGRGVHEFDEVDQAEELQVLVKTLKEVETQGGHDLGVKAALELLSQRGL